MHLNTIYYRKLKKSYNNNSSRRDKLINKDCYNYSKLGYFARDYWIKNKVVY
jgi:hypothetical protein